MLRYCATPDNRADCIVRISCACERLRSACWHCHEPTTCAVAREWQTIRYSCLSPLRSLLTCKFTHSTGGARLVCAERRCAVLMQSEKGSSSVACGTFYSLLLLLTLTISA